MIETRPANTRSAPLIDVAIIGGGVAGAYTAYRLMKADPNTSPILRHLLEMSAKRQLEVGLFEISNRIGGRLWSHYFPDMPTLPAELGGGGFSELQQNVYGLCTKGLNLSVRPSSSYNKLYFHYLRGHRFNHDQYNPQEDQKVDSYYPNVIPYFLKESEKWKEPDSLVREVFLQRIPLQARKIIKRITDALGRRNIEKALHEIRVLTHCLRTERVGDDSSAFAGRPIYESGFWNILEEALSSEAYQMALHSSFAFSIFRNFNFYDSLLNRLLSFFCYMLNPTPWYELKKGYQELPETLIEHFRKKGGLVYLQRQLYSLQLIEENGERLIALTFGTPGELSRTIFYARYVVLALPQRALKLLDPDSFIFRSPELRANIDAVTPVPASKLFLSYDKPWWEALDFGVNKVLTEKITSGCSTTDLPLRACYYIGAQEGEKALLLASLSDDSASQFWDGYLSAVHLNNSSLKGEDRLSVPTEMIAAAQRQLKEMHNYSSIPEPCAAIYYNWMRDPFGGGWHCWKPHVRSWEVMPRIRQPIPNVNVFLCGEAYSARQGWVEGALNTAEMVLETHFQVPRPTWVPTEYDFGP